MRLTSSNRGQGEVDRRLWFGQPWDERGYLRLSTWRSCHLASAELQVGGEEQELRLTLSLLWRALSFAVLLPFWKWKLPYETREIGASLVWFDEDAVWDIPLSVGVWRDSMGGSSDQNRTWPWRGDGWHFYWHPLRWIPGDTRHEKDESAVRTATVVVRLPEGDYPATYTAERVRWQRPRWFRAPWVWRCSIEVEGGVPVPGKGENSWDCGDDATHSIAFAVTEEPMEPYEAAQRFAMDVLRSRQRHGSLQWTPDGGWPQHCVRVA